MGATRSIVARRLLKQAKIWKTNTRMEDGITINSLGKIDVIVCLGDGLVTQRCSVLDTDSL